MRNVLFIPTFVLHMVKYLIIFCVFKFYISQFEKNGCDVSVLRIFMISVFTIHKTVYEISNA